MIIEPQKSSNKMLALTVIHSTKPTAIRHMAEAIAQSPREAERLSGNRRMRIARLPGSPSALRKSHHSSPNNTPKLPQNHTLSGQAFGPSHKLTSLAVATCFRHRLCQAKSRLTTMHTPASIDLIEPAALRKPTLPVIMIRSTLPTDCSTWGL